MLSGLIYPKLDIFGRIVKFYVEIANNWNKIVVSVFVNALV